MSVLDFFRSKAEPESVPAEAWQVTRLREVRIELAKTTAELESIDSVLSAEFFNNGPDPRVAAIFSNVESVTISGDMARFRFLTLQRNLLDSKRTKLADEYRNLLVGGSYV